MPHAPQLLGSCCSSTQLVGALEGQPEKPLLHAKPHWLEAQVACALAGAFPHEWPQAPQSLGLPVVSTQVPLHSVGAAEVHPVVHA